MSQAIHALQIMQCLAGQIGEGKTLDGDEKYALRIVRAYCEAIEEGGSLEPADIYDRAMGKKAA